MANWQWESHRRIGRSYRRGMSLNNRWVMEQRAAAAKEAKAAAAEAKPEQPQRAPIHPEDRAAA